MVCYGMGILPLLRSKVNFPLQNSNGLQIMDKQPEKVCRHPCAVGTSATWTQVRYFPESLWRILVVASHHVEQAKVEFAGLNFQVETGSRYLGSFVGEATERDSWVAGKVNV